ncbi:hypothetical protein SNEBB_007858 [Seison nebaliae]|nr:hypothetical protein SNEBB_007858 [Seison nebaliae]
MKSISDLEKQISSLEGVVGKDPQYYANVTESLIEADSVFRSKYPKFHILATPEKYDKIYKELLLYPTNNEMTGKDVNVIIQKEKNISESINKLNMLEELSANVSLLNDKVLEKYEANNKELRALLKMEEELKNESDVVTKQYNLLSAKYKYLVDKLSS